MGHYRYVLVGGGVAADAAVQGIRSLDDIGRIGLVHEEAFAPYDRPPLSKGLWRGDSDASVFRAADRHGVELLPGRRVVRLSTASRTVTDDRGESHGYERLLLATGAAPRLLPGAEGRAYRTLDDYRRLREEACPGRTALVVGGGLLGSELAAALAGAGVRVTQLMPEGGGPCARLFPKALAAQVSHGFASRGIRVETGVTAERSRQERGRWQVVSARGAAFEADLLVTALGVEPRVELARSGGVVVEEGVVVDERLRTSDPSVFAAGDVAVLPMPVLGGRRRFEHEDAALSMGHLAGRNMAGADERYGHLPMFYGELFELGFEAVGDIDARLETVEAWRVPGRVGVVYYGHGGRVRGVLVCGLSGRIDTARALIARGVRFTPSELMGRLPLD